MKRYSEIHIPKLANGSPLPITQKEKAIAACNKGNDLCESKNYDGALQCYNEAIALSPRHIDAYYNKALLLADDLKRHEESLHYYDKALSLNQDDAEIYYHKANALSNLARYEEAIECYDSAIALNQNYAAAHNAKGNAFCDLGRNEDALESYNLAITLGYIGAYNNKAIVLNSLGRYKEALECYDESIRLDPDDCAPYNGKGNVFDNLGRHEEALECYNKSIELNPEFFHPYNGKGNALERLGRHEEALVCYNKSIELNPEFFNSYYGKGNSLGSLGLYEEAIASCNEAIKLNPSNLLTYCNKGMALKNLGKEVEALACFNKAYDLAKEDDADKGLSEGNIEYIVAVLSEDRQELLKKVNEFQQASIETKEQLANLDQNNEEVKMVVQEFNSIELKGKDILTSALESIMGKTGQDDNLKDALSLLIPLLSQMQARLTWTENELASQGSTIKVINSKIDDFSLKLDLNRESVNALMQEMQEYGVTKDVVAEFMPFLGSLREMIHQHESDSTHNAILDSIRKHPYKGSFDENFRKVLISTYLASSAVETNIIRSDKVGLIGKLGNILETASNYVPMFGGGVHLLGMILGKVDEIHQRQLLSNYAKFASSPAEMDNLSSNLSMVLVDDRLGKSHLDRLDDIAIINSIMNALISAGNILGKDGNNHGNSVVENKPINGWNPFKKKGNLKNSDDNGDSDHGYDSNDLGAKHAKIVSSFIIGKIFDGTVTNSPPRDVSCVVSIIELVCDEFHMIDGQRCDMSDILQGCVLFETSMMGEHCHPHENDQG